MRSLVLPISLSLLACSGTAVQYAGPLCGSATPAQLTLADRKDRSGFEASCRQTYYDADGKIARVDEIVISSSESSASSVVAAQAEAISRLVDAIAIAKP